jgi:hypothetical protein
MAESTTSCAYKSAIIATTREECHVNEVSIHDINMLFVLYNQPYEDAAGADPPCFLASILISFTWA